MNSGGGGNYLCLPEKPDRGRVVGGLQNGGRMQGVEYQLNQAAGLFSQVNNRGQSLHSLAAPCVVCHVPSRSNQIMIPAKLNCPEGWTKEYNGYIVSSSSVAPTHKTTTFICLDEAPEAVPGSLEEKYGALFYPVEADCAHSLPCPKYVAGDELTCVVCSK